jgi:hypothetical protein
VLGLRASAVEAAVPFEAHGNLTADEFQKKADALKDQKYRLHDLNAYLQDGTVRYCAVWLKKDGPEYEAQRNLTARELQAKSDALMEKGFRLTRVSAVTIDGEPRYCAIWQKIEGDWRSQINLTAKELQDTTDSYRAQGYLVVELTSRVVKSEARFCAVWQKRASEGYESHANLSGKDLQERTDAYIPAGYRIMRCSTFVLDGEVRYCGVWEKQKNGFWGARTAITAKELGEKTAEYKEKGYHVAELNATVLDGEVRYSVVWEK